MNIGDRVRLLHGKEEGVITRLSSGGQVEIEIEDGFRIPAMKSEVVVIDKAEKEYFDTPSSSGAIYTGENRPKPIENVHKGGFFLAYVPYNDQVHDVLLINTTIKEYLFSVDELQGEASKNVAAGVLLPGSSTKVAEKMIRDFEQWPALKFLMVPLNKQVEASPKPIERKVKFKASAFFKHKGKAPLIEKEAYFFKLNEQEKLLDVKKLNEELNPTDASTFPAKKVSRPAASIDLHIEKLTKDHDLMSNGEMVQLQLAVFEKNLNDAIASGMDEITFIHGIGNGVLRKEIHRYLSQMKGIKYFKDSQKTNFGYGATAVKIHE
ncbi:Smr/MutS family protein [Cyclobacterium salsum]|uniref:Smr/MutS family protein n=1 Tax=Cyclobacterium salsum TaxID=2666329 RepID=UPI00139145B5|nr:Smr/MutS family protein [Cyclobacterium salsum]